MAYFMFLNVGARQVPRVATNPMRPGGGSGPSTGPKLTLVNGKLEYSSTIPTGGRLVAYQPP